MDITRGTCTETKQLAMKQHVSQDLDAVKDSFCEKVSGNNQDDIEKTITMILTVTDYFEILEISQLKEKKSEHIDRSDRIPEYTPYLFVN